MGVARSCCRGASLPSDAPFPSPPSPLFPPYPSFSMYDEFGNYIGPDLRDEDEDEEGLDAGQVRGQWVGATPSPASRADRSCTFGPPVGRVLCVHFFFRGGARGAGGVLSA